MDLSSIPNKDTRALVKRAHDVGWRTAESNGKYTVYPPGGTAPIVIQTGARVDLRSVRNTEARLKRAGLCTAEDVAAQTKKARGRGETNAPIQLPPEPPMSDTTPPSEPPVDEIGGLIRLGRLLAQLPADKVLLTQFLGVLDLANSIGLDIAELHRALEGVLKDAKASQ